MHLYQCGGQERIEHKPPIVTKWDKYKLLWEYNKKTGIFKQFEYTIAGQKWVLKRVNVRQDIDRNRKIEKNAPWLYSLNYDVHGHFMNMTHNGATLKLIPEKSLPSIDSLDDRAKKEAVLKILTGEILSYVEEMEENKEKVTEMQRNAELALSQSELTKLIGMLDNEISRAKRQRETLETDFRQPKIEIEKKQSTYFVGKEGHCKILEAKWEGLVCPREIRYDPWTQRLAYEKTFSKSGQADRFHEIDEQGNQRLYAKYEYSGIQMAHIVTFDPTGIPDKRILFNCHLVAPQRALYTCSPYGLQIRVSETKMIPWPPKLKWPVEPEMISLLMCHNDHAIIPVRAVRR